jgi:hypothetical protein
MCTPRLRPGAKSGEQSCGLGHPPMMVPGGDSSGSKGGYPRRGARHNPSRYFTRLDAMRLPLSDHVGSAWAAAKPMTAVVAAQSLTALWRAAGARRASRPRTSSSGHSLASSKIHRAILTYCFRILRLRLRADSRPAASWLGVVTVAVGAGGASHAAGEGGQDTAGDAPCSRSKRHLHHRAWARWLAAAGGPPRTTTRSALRAASSRGPRWRHRAPSAPLGQRPLR